jgi:hypothetical protein
MTSVATVITRLEGGAGVMALRGVLGLDRSAFEPVIVTGSGGPRYRLPALRSALEAAYFSNL